MNDILKELFERKIFESLPKIPNENKVLKKLNKSKNLEYYLRYFKFGKDYQILDNYIKRYIEIPSTLKNCDIKDGEEWNYITYVFLICYDKDIIRDILTNVDIEKYLDDNDIIIPNKDIPKKYQISIPILEDYIKFLFPEYYEYDYETIDEYIENGEAMLEIYFADYDYSKLLSKELTKKNYFKTIEDIYWEESHIPYFLLFEAFFEVNKYLYTDHISNWDSLYIYLDIYKKNKVIDVEGLVDLINNSPFFGEDEIEVEDIEEFGITELTLRFADHYNPSNKEHFNLVISEDRNISKKEFEKVIKFLIELSKFIKGGK